MKYGLVQKLTLDHSECLVLGILNDGDFPLLLSTFDEGEHPSIKRLYQKVLDNKGVVWQSDMNGKSLLLIHCKDKASFNAVMLQKITNQIADHLLKQGIRSATICLPQVANQTANAQVEQMLIQFNQRFSQFLDFKSQNNTPHCLESLHFYLEGASVDAIEYGQSVAHGMLLARTLANAPANVCTPTFIATKASELAKENASITTRTFDKKDIEEMGMGAFLAVAKGSHEPPQFIEIQYKGAKDNAQPVVLIGKGITFDSGGISLKPGDGMNEMKYDMCGAASVLGTLKACAELKLPINVVGLLACTENMPGGRATKPGDIVKSMSGQTIEIINTDAEGRLVLADALTYAQRFNPHLVIDIATLTGAIIIALGFYASGYMTKDEELARMLEDCAKKSNDPIWRMPLDDSYQDALDSPLADMVNATFDRVAGSVTAACFLSRFAQKFRWAHLDIAGTAWVSGKKNDATGRPVPLLTQLLRHVANSR